MSHWTAGLRLAGFPVRRPEATIAVADHNIPTEDRRGGIKDEKSRLQVETLEANVEEFGVPYIRVLDVRQGIVHIIGPELGFSLPGQTIVSGDSHASTHSAIIGRLGAAGANPGAPPAVTSDSGACTLKSAISGLLYGTQVLFETPDSRASIRWESII